MSRLMRHSGPLAAALLLALGIPARGQMMSAPVNTTNAAATVNALANGAGLNPYALSTLAGSNFNGVAGLGASNPYTASLGVGAANPYGLSTSPFGYGGYGYSPYFPYQMDPIGAGLMGYGYSLQGMASLTKANADYWKETQAASLMRERVRQESMNTARRRIEMEMWYDTVRPTAVTMRTREVAADLDNARRVATETDILSGRALNTLLASIQKSGRLNTGPTVPLEEDVVRKVNVTGGTSGNVALLKDSGKLNWPEAFQAEQFDEPRKRLTRNVALAVQTLKDGEAVRPDLIRDIRGDAKAVVEALDETANDLSPPQYIEARRFLRQLNNATAALADPKVVNYFNNTWQARGKNVAELVGHMTRNGLRFAPATSGDEAAYRAVYQGLRAFEAGLQVAQRDIGTGR